MNTIFGGFTCFGLVQGQATEWRGETEAMCLTGSARILLTLSVFLPSSPFSPRDQEDDCLVYFGINMDNQNLSELMMWGGDAVWSSLSYRCPKL